MAASADKRWLQLVKFTLEIDRYCILSLQSKLIVYTQSFGIFANSYSYNSALQSYDINKNEWHQLISSREFQEKVDANDIDGTRCILDVNTNKLYLNKKHTLDLIEVDLNTK